MNTQYTIVLQDGDVLSRVCGTNDSNLKLIENHLGIPVFTRGNEIFIDSGEPEIQQEFKFIIDRITDEISDSQENSSDSDMVNSILNVGLADGFSGNFDAGKYAVSIPGAARKIYPKTKSQSELIKSFRENDLIFAEGPAGSGKTFLAVAEALRLVLSKKVSSLVLARPVVEAGESLGFLPGDLDEKINPYLRPLYDSINACLPRELSRKLFESGIIETAPLAYMRGRTLSNCAVVLDEAQNTTAEQMKMFLTRMGENAKIFVTGDVSQVDLPKKCRSGLSDALEILKNIDGVGIVHLSGADVVRSGLARKIVLAYENKKNRS